MRAQRGFTLIELLIAMAVLVIASTLAVPSFITFIQNNRLASQTNEIVAALQFARSEAVKRGVWAELCASADQNSCGGNMNDGWVVNVNPAGLGPDEENPLRVWSIPGDRIAITAVQNSARFISNGCFDHNKDGECSTHFGSGSESPFLVVEENPDIDSIQPRQIKINLTGRVTACREDPDDATSCQIN